MTKLVAALTFLGLNFYVYNYFANDPVIPPRTSFAEFPVELPGAWNCTPETMEDDVFANLGVTDYLLCTFIQAGTGRAVGAYVGYHETQVREEGGGSSTLR